MSAPNGIIRTTVDVESSVAKSGGLKCGFDIVVRDDIRVAHGDMDTVGKEFRVLGQSIVGGGRKRERIDEFMRIGRTTKMFDDEGDELLEHVC